MNVRRRQACADVLDEARETAAAIPPLTEGWPAMTVADAYAIQQLGVARRVAAGGRVVGHKLGLTAAAVQRQLGVGEPDYGTLLGDMEVPHGGALARGRLIAPRVEAEVAFVLAAPLAGPGVDEDAVVAAVDHVRAAIEVVDSRIADWRIRLQDTVADNASSAAYVLGERRRRLDEVEIDRLQAELRIVGAVAETGLTSAVLGDPRTAVAWLANRLAELGSGLRAGDVVLSGACTRMVEVDAGDAVTVQFDGLGEVAVRFEEGVS